MFEYEDENGQEAIVLSKVSYVNKTTDINIFSVYFVVTIYQLICHLSNILSL